jgi:hypothetical protein
LKLVAAATQELFNGTIAEIFKYAQQGVLVFEHMREPEGVTNKLKACLIRLSTPLTYEKISAY